MIESTFGRVTLTLALSLAACSKDDAVPTTTVVATGAAPATAGAGRNPCKLLTPGQIESAIGTSVTKTVPYGDVECRWSVTPLPAFAGSESTWVDVQFGSTETQMGETEAASAGVVSIEGLGDRAFRTNQTRHLWVKHGSDIFTVRSRLRALSDQSETTRATAEAIEVSLARLVLAQL